MSERTLDFKGTVKTGVKTKAKQYGEDRRCEELGCTVKLSRYNPEPRCWEHRMRLVVPLIERRP